tara:strand:- start:1612 stop:2187 length:576 start_codon:yes stop_codon:yes gene_type:complete
MEILDFRYITTKDISDNDLFNDGYAWSRCHEYPLVLDCMSKLLNEGSTVHNSSWGFAGIHITFKDELDKIYKNTIHSDIKHSDLKNTTCYNIRTPPPKRWKEKFDCVLNVSTLEEVGGNHCEIFDNLYSQVKPSGYFICTFDYPGLQLQKIEEKLGKKIELNGIPINGGNSIIKNLRYKHLNCGLMVVRKK